MRKTGSSLAASALVAALVSIGACSRPDSTAPVISEIPLAPLASTVPFVPEPEIFEVCKTYPAGVNGPTVTIDWSVYHEDDGHTEYGSTTLAGGTCKNIAIGGTLTHDHLVTVTEQVPTGFAATHSDIEYHQGAITTYPTEMSATTSGSMNGDRGWTVIFVNRGTRGCTHGYWKQEHHEWPNGLARTTMFGSVFENAFPGLTLDDVLSLQGGGLNALGREAVAALLNANAEFYWYGSSEVVQLFNAAYPGAKTEYTALKDTFEGYNVAGCPLN